MTDEPTKDTSPDGDSPQSSEEQTPHPAKQRAAPETTSSDTGSKPKPKSKDRWVKIGFLVLIVVVAAVVYSLQQKPMTIEGWSEDLPATLTQATQQGRPVLVLFVRTPPSKIAEQTKTAILRPQNQKSMAERKLLKVLISTEPDSDVAGRYNIENLPTLLLLSPTGIELNRHDGPGHIGEVPFRQEFLSVLSK
ncbi:MAG: hypothetical protein GVY16_05580 [Planctomycetes bacterium]|jgi:hypothetical protein|nr:hypothetical protein [Planctomycetota bacterium]